MKYGWTASLMLLLGLLTSCQSCQEQVNSLVPEDQKKTIAEEDMLRFHQQAARAEAKFIEVMVDSLDWKGQFFPEGYGLWITDSIGENKVQSGDTLLLEWDRCLLEESPEKQWLLKPSRMVVDYSEWPSGIHFALKQMKIGQKAKIILPSHLAYGLSGDGEAIPPTSTLMYSIAITEKIKE